MVVMETGCFFCFFLIVLIFLWGHLRLLMVTRIKMFPRVPLLCWSHQALAVVIVMETAKTSVSR